MKAVKGYFKILFYESLNKKCQAKQIDIHVPAWEGDKVVKVVTRYTLVHSFWVMLLLMIWSSILRRVW